MDFAKTAEQLCDVTRGMTPWPGAYAGLYKVLKAQPQPWEGGEAPGTVLKADAKAGLWLRAGDGALQVTRMQAAGGKPMDARDYLRGHAIDVGASIAPEEKDAE